MEAIVLVLNNLRESKIDDMLMYLESMYMETETETLVFIDYVHLTMVNKALYKFVNNLGYKRFKICQEDYMLYKVIVKHGYKALFYIDDLDLCAKFLKKFGYVYNSSISNASKEIIISANDCASCQYELVEYIHPKYLKLTNSDYYIYTNRSSDEIRKECEYFGFKRLTNRCNVKNISYYNNSVSPIFTAAKNNNFEKFHFLLCNSQPKEILKDYLSLKSGININGNSILQYLLENSIHKYDVNDLLKIAIKNKNIPAVAYLLNKEPNLHNINKKGVLLIMHCCSDTVFMILEKMDLNVLYDGKNLLEYILCWNKRIIDRRRMLGYYVDYHKIKTHGKAPGNVSEEQNKILQYDLLVDENVAETVRTAFIIHQQSS